MKRLAIFLDGTWNTLNNNTNVWRLTSLTTATAEQRVHYSQGVGTQRGEAARGALQNPTRATSGHSDLSGPTPIVRPMS
jgi:uncharacterized protein (DUF2235 family)